MHRKREGKWQRQKLEKKSKSHITYRDGINIFVYNSFVCFIDVFWCWAALGKFLQNVFFWRVRRQQSEKEKSSDQLTWCFTCWLSCWLSRRFITRLVIWFTCWFTWKLSCLLVRRIRERKRMWEREKNKKNNWPDLWTVDSLFKSSKCFLKFLSSQTVSRISFLILWTILYRFGGCIYEKSLSYGYLDFP